MLQTFLGKIMLSKIEFDIKLGHKISNVADVTHSPPADCNIETQGISRLGVSGGTKLSEGQCSFGAALFTGAC
jgi:hypothetical protein